MDRVKCNNCGAKMIVEAGTDKCPTCNANGSLSWMEGEQEIETDRVATDRKGYISNRKFLYISKDNFQFFITEIEESFEVVRIDNSGYIGIEKWVFLEKNFLREYIEKFIDLEDGSVELEGDLGWD